MWAWVLGTLAGRAESRSGCGLGVLKAACLLVAGSGRGGGGGRGRKGRGVRGRRGEGGGGGGCCVVAQLVAWLEVFQYWYLLLGWGTAGS